MLWDGLRAGGCQCIGHGAGERPFSERGAFGLELFPMRDSHSRHTFLLTVCTMTRVIALLVAGLLLGSCSTMPQWMGGMPKDAPPRPGTPEYDEFRQKLEAERTRDKRQDPKSDTATVGRPPR
jgi:hypothetical protein